MVLRINIRFKLVSYKTVIRVRLIDVKSSQYALNDNDTNGNVNKLLEKCKSIPSIVSPATDLRKPITQYDLNCL